MRQVGDDTAPGRADPRAARQREVGAVEQTTVARAVRRLRDQRAAAAGRDDRGLSDHAGDDASSRTTYQVIALYQQNELHQVSRATKPSSRSHEPGRSSRRRWTRSSGRRARASSRSAARCRQTGTAPAPPGRFAGEADGRSKHADMFFPPARSATARSTPSTRRLHDPAQGDPAGRREDRLPDPEAALT